MVKAPIAGFVKTRLTPPLSPSEAASLAHCFLKDIVDSLKRVSPKIIVAFTPPEGRVVLERSLSKQLLWFAQKGNDLGERLNSAVAHARDLGFNPIIVLGADSPTIPASFIETGLNALVSRETDVVLGPTTDGGYYLIGLNRSQPELFQDIQWSSPSTFQQTARKANQLNVRLLTLPEWYDVDTPADLITLSNELLSHPEVRGRAPATCQWLLDHKRLNVLRD
jgi:rSAM/selenodomain-associated transferase 1